MPPKEDTAFSALKGGQLSEWVSPGLPMRPGGGTRHHRRSRGWLERLAVRLGRRREVHGILVSAFTEKATQDLALERVTAALELIRRYHPAGFRRVQRGLKRILVCWTPGNWGEYQADLDLCMMNESRVCAPETSIAAIASTVVHEATHARLARAGFPYDENLQSGPTDDGKLAGKKPLRRSRGSRFENRKAFVTRTTARSRRLLGRMGGPGATRGYRASCVRRAVRAAVGVRRASTDAGVSSWTYHSMTEWSFSLEAAPQPAATP
jgi:hypothetical protein